MKKVTNISQNIINDLVIRIFWYEFKVLAGMSSDDALKKSVLHIKKTDLSCILLLFERPRQYLLTAVKILFRLFYYLFQEKFITFLKAREFIFNRALCFIERTVIILMLFLKFVPFNTDIDGVILTALF